MDTTQVVVLVSIAFSVGVGVGIVLAAFVPIEKLPPRRDAGGHENPRSRS